MMRASNLLALALLLLVPGTGASIAAQTADTAGEPASRIAVDVYPEGADRGTGTAATLSLTGRIRGPALDLAFPVVDAGRLTPAETRVADYLGALARGDRDGILSFWSPEERAAAAERLSGHLEQVQRMHRAVEGLTFFGEVDYGPYVLVLVEVDFGERALHRSYPLERTGGSLFFTDALAADLFFGDIGRWLIAALEDGRARVSAQPAAEPVDGLEVLAGAIRYGFGPEAGSADGSVVLTLEGEVFPEGLALVGAPSEAAETSESVDTEWLRGVFEAWREGSYEQVLALWAPSQQARFTRFFPPESFPAQRRIFQLADEILLLARLGYGPYEIVVVELVGAPREAAGRALAVRREGQERLLTYELLDDPVFDLWRESLAERLAGEIGEPKAEEAGREGESGEDGDADTAGSGNDGGEGPADETTGGEE